MSNGSVSPPKKEVDPTVDLIVKRVMKDLSEEFFKGLQRSINRRVRKELKAALIKEVEQSEFYRVLNEDMMHGLQGIYRQITHATEQKNASTLSQDKEATDRILSDASRQLDEILVTTEEATLNIMNTVEKHMELQEKVGTILSEAQTRGLNQEKLTRLQTINQELTEDLMHIISMLSFQDLTGQRIKKIVAALQTIEKTVFDLYMSTGLVLLAKEKDPEKNIEEIKKETQQVVSELKGPQLATSQAAVDDLLESLGL